MDRRNSNDERTPRESTNPNVFDDEFAIDPNEDDFMPVSDGFRPMMDGGWDQDRSDHNRDPSPPPPRRSYSATKNPETDLRRLASRNSIAKPPRPARESLSHDIRPGFHTREASSQAAALQHRASISSTGSFAPMARSESPFGTGPSHPYGMYPQNTAVARSSSVTTSSTQAGAGPHRSVSLQRPAHPYGMYTQNVIETPDEEPVPPVPAAAAIPVGLPGLNTAYHRRIGPDGEEQDIVGPDGYTEQLPPYSRYPEEGPTKAALAAEVSSSPVETPVAPPNASNEALITPVQRQPNQQSSVSPHSRQASEHEAYSTEARAVPVAVAPSISTTLSSSEQGVSEKQEPPKGFKSWASKRLWGKIPLGVVLILLVLVLVFAIILGAAIGSFVAKGKNDDHHKNKSHTDPQSEVQLPTGTLFDATPIPTPSSLPPLPSGVFALPLGLAQESSPGCLTVVNQLSAWSCGMTYVPLLLTINNSLPNGDAQWAASVQPIAKPDGGIQYGVQAPTLPLESLELVEDLDAPQYDEAFHLQGKYNKRVIISPDGFAAGQSLRKRQGDVNPGLRHRFQVQPGDEPWYCDWNQTFIEIYIYVRNNSSAASFTGLPSAWPTAVPSSAADSAPSTVYATSTSSASVTSAARLLHKRADGDFPRYPAYPRVIKMEERRLPGSPQAVCQKMQLLSNGAVVPVEDSQGNPVKVQLSEQDPSLQDFLAAEGRPAATTTSSASSSQNSSSKGRRREIYRRDDPGNACHCQWMFQ